LRKHIIIILIFILLLAGLNEVQFKSRSSPDSILEPDDDKNRPTIFLAETKENPLSINVEEENVYLDENNRFEKIESLSDKSPFTIAEKNDILLPQKTIEIDENFIQNQKQINKNFKNDISVFTPTDGKKALIMQNINEINGYFTENRGQVGNDSVRYYIQGAGVWFLDDGVVFELRENVETRDRGDELLIDPMARYELPEPVEYRSVVIKMEFVGANLVTPRGKNRISWNNNYFYGNDSTNWCTDVPNYCEIIYENLYENIDLRYYVSEKGLKYDFIVHPEGEPDNIKFKIIGSDDLFINNEMNLTIMTEFGPIVDSDLYIYQEIENNKQKIGGRFNIIDSKIFGFNISDDFNRNIDLIIDPFLNYSTYVGGSGTDWPLEISIDLEGNAYIAGRTNSLNFPITSYAYDNTFNGGIGSNHWDIFIYKLNKNGSNLIYSTFIGGYGNDNAYGLTLDIEGNAYLTGITISSNNTSNFPITSNAFDKTYNGGSSDIIILKLNQNGSSILYSTFIGGSYKDRDATGRDYAYDISIDTNGNSYITGWTTSSNFPTTNNAFDTTYNGNDDLLIVKINSNGSKLLYSTFIGGNYVDIGHDITIDDKGNAYVTGETGSVDFPNTTKSFDITQNGGQDCFALKLNQNGSKLIYSTFIGGSDYEIGYGIVLDSNYNAYITGGTRSDNFPVTSNAYNTIHNGNGTNFDAFILKLNTNGSIVLDSTYLGGKNFDTASDIRLDEQGYVYVIGQTYSNNFPTTIDAYDESLNGSIDAFIIKINNNVSKLNYSTLIGGNHYEMGYEIELDLENNMYVTGYTKSSDFPTTHGVYDTTYNGNNTVDCFVMKFDQNKTNNPPIISSFTATPSPEGSKVIFTVDASDLDNDTLTYSFDFQNDSIFDLNTSNNSTSFIWGDDYKGTATVLVSDGKLNSKANTSVIVYNIAPKPQVKVISKNQSIGYASLNLSVRIAGEKWHDVKVELYKNGNEITNGSLIRCPGSPNEQTLHLLNQTLDSTFNWTAILYYTPNDDPINGKPNGATPCWIILNLSNGTKIKLHHTFKVKHKKTHIWRVNLTKVLPSTGNSIRKGTFNITVFDPGADNITLYLDFGDGTNITKFYPNNNQTYPVSINVTLSHNYASSGTFSVILIAKDDDGGITIVKVSIDFG
jgi:hypothetical protein